MIEFAVGYGRASFRASFATRFDTLMNAWSREERGPTRWITCRPQAPVRKEKSR